MVGPNRWDLSCEKEIEYGGDGGIYQMDVGINLKYKEI